MQAHTCTRAIYTRIQRRGARSAASGPCRRSRDTQSHSCIARRTARMAQPSWARTAAHASIARFLPRSRTPAARPRKLEPCMLGVPFSPSAAPHACVSIRPRAAVRYSTCCHMHPRQLRAAVQASRFGRWPALTWRPHRRSVALACASLAATRSCGGGPQCVCCRQGVGWSGSCSTRLRRPRRRCLAWVEVIR